MKAKTMKYTHTKQHLNKILTAILANAVKFKIFKDETTN
jgi:hypothetical protein